MEKIINITVTFRYNDLTNHKTFTYTLRVFFFCGRKVPIDWPISCIPNESEQYDETIRLKFLQVLSNGFPTIPSNLRTASCFCAHCFLEQVRKYVFNITSPKKAPLQSHLQLL